MVTPEMMAGNQDIWSSPEPAASMLPFSSSIEWVPLPEVKSLRESQSYSNLHNIIPNKGTYNSHSSPTMNSTVSHLDNIQSNKTPSNLTILSLGSSLPNQSTTGPIINSHGTPLSGPSASIPHFDPSHLDELWKQFLKTVIIPSNGYRCNCHLKPSENEPVFNPLPLGKENESVANNGRMYRTQNPHTKTFVPIDTPFSYSYSSKETQTSTVPRYKPIIDVTTPLLMESTPTLEKLSLQEACYLMKKKFIINSKKRQETIKQKMAKRELQPWQPKAPPIIKPSIVYPTKPSNERPKLSFKTMFEQSKKNWTNLPEVKERLKKERNEREAATNRLRARLYQQKVLYRMRRIQEKKNKRIRYHLDCIK